MTQLDTIAESEAEKYAKKINKESSCLQSFYELRKIGKDGISITLRSQPILLEVIVESIAHAV